MSDPRVSSVSVTNHGGFCGRASIKWQHGDHQDESDVTDTYCAGVSRTIDLMKYYQAGRISTGDTCWVYWHMDGGDNKQSGENVTFDATTSAYADYALTGTVNFPSFSRSS